MQLPVSILLKTSTVLSFVFFFNLAFSQQGDSIRLGYEDYLALVLNNHPAARQAQLLLTASELLNMRANGQFDPKLYFDADRKEFKGSEYYSLIEGGLKVPTQLGFDIKGGYEYNDGIFLNPERRIPEEGQVLLGISVPVFQGIVVNDRMLERNRGRLMAQGSRIDRIRQLNVLLFDAAKAYWEWNKAYRKLQIYENALQLVNLRVSAVKASVELGEEAGIDSIEAISQQQQFAIDRRAALAEFQINTLKLSNFLWLSNRQPAQLGFDVIPPDMPALELPELDDLAQPISELQLWHPELLFTQNKIDQLTLERRQKFGKTLPKLTVDYSLLSSIESVTPDAGNYKAGISVKYPLFTRIERANLGLADIKLRTEQLALEQKLLEQQNKILTSYYDADAARDIIAQETDKLASLQRLYDGELQKFDLGESSLFLVNSREQKLIKARLDLIQAIINFYKMREKLQFETAARRVQFER